MKKLIAVLAVLLASCSGEYIVESSEVIMPPTQVTPDNSIPPVGYLWWPKSPVTKVFIRGEKVQTIPGILDRVVTEKEVADGFACLANPGDMYQINNTVDHPKDTYGINILTGDCIGWRGWMETPEAFQITRKP